MIARSLKLSLAAVAAVSLTATAALAHPGHEGGLVGGLAHPFTGLDHLLAMVAVGLWASQLGKRAMIALPLLFPAVMAIGALMGANGIALPWVEAGIVASVVILGAVVALGVKPSLAVSATLVGVFALFHGHAHGTELPAAGSALMYGVGFIAATLVLHAIGMGIGVAAKRPLAMRYAGGAIAAAGLVLLVVH
ncbi:MAG: HupE/UreJ family protein [Pseudomonadota bacterium]